jgi:phospholipid/cholesterol/gamma-HCH transport system permease protein
VRSIPIVCLMCFLIGAIVAQQGAFQLRRFGAEAFAAQLVAVLSLRELGVLLAAIMFAGRTGSAFTAELGSMKMREEIDALRVTGLDPIEVLVLPRVLALIIALPIVTILANFAALAGGAVTLSIYAGVEIAAFVDTLQNGIRTVHTFVGVSKAPAMALMIGLVSCYEGLRVKGSAESLGQRVTAAVVTSIFLVIVLDGIFAVVYAAFGA